MIPPSAPDWERTVVVDLEPDTAPRLRPRPTMRPALLVSLAALVSLWIFGCSVMVLTTGCGATPRTVAHVTVVSMGSALAALHRNHQRVYTEATDALRHEIAARHGTLAEYDTAVRPIDDAFDGRSGALQALDADLYGAAACIDASRLSGDALTVGRACAGPLLAAVTRDLESLREGDALPAVEIPSEVLATLRALTLLAGGASPAPTTDGGSDG